MTFYFAWVNSGTAFNAGTHSVQDEEVFAFEMTHTEGDLPQLSLDIRNPRINLLDPGRKVWAWLSQDGNPIFYGRLVAAPEQIQNELIHLNFVARPIDYKAQKAALAATMRELPYFDAIWLNEQRLLDPDTVLEARPELWHIDRTTHVLTSSNIIAGEDGTEVFTADDHFYNDVAVTYGSAPLRRVTIKATVSWDQVARGNMDLTHTIKEAFDDAGSPGGIVSSYTGQGLESDWPKANANFNGGWTTGRITLKRLDGISRRARSKNVRVDNITQGTDSSGDRAANTLKTPGIATFFVWEFRPEFPMKYDVSRKRIETVNFTLEADVQAIIVDPGEDEEELITLSSKAVGEIDPTDPYSEPPIVDLRRRSYMCTDRGLQSFQYLLLLARATLLSRARAVTVRIVTTFERGMELSCRMNAQVFDPRLPGGSVFGKIIEYTLHADGDGKQFAAISIGCTIGEGNTVTASGGDPTYVVTGYVNEGYQVYSDVVFAVVEDELTWEDYTLTPINDDGIDFLHFTESQAVVSCEVFNGESDQNSLLTPKFSDIPAAIEALNTDFTECELVLVNLKGGPFQTDYNVTVSDLMIPKTIEL